MKEQKKKKSYELNCLFALSDGQKIQTIKQKIVEWTKKNEGEMITLEKTDENGKVVKGSFWVEKKYFAYPIRKNKAGFYLYTFFAVDPARIDDLSRMLKLESGVVRFMITDSQNVAKMIPVGAGEIDSIEELSSREKGEVEKIEKNQEKEINAEKKTIEENEAEVKNSVEESPEIKKEIIIAEEIEETPEKPEPIVEKKEEEDSKEEIDEIAELKKEEGPDKIEKNNNTVVVEEKEESTTQKEAEAESETEIEKPAKEVKKESEGEIEKSDEKTDKKKDSKQKKISLDDLDRRLDDILNEEIL